MRVIFAAWAALAAAAAQDTFSIAGRVTRTTDDGGVGRAMVNLIGVVRPAEGALRTRESNRSTITAADGSFRFDGLAPGQYYLNTSHPQYAPPPNLNPESLPVGPSKENVRLWLTPLASIEGTVTDQDGSPVEAVSIQAIRATVQSGLRRHVPGQETRTDDRGRFRISKLPAGEWFLRAGPPQWGTSPSTGDRLPVILTRLVPRAMFAGGEERIAAAQPISLGAGDHKTIDFRLNVQPGTRIAGTLSGHAAESPVGFQLLGAHGDPTSQFTFFNSRTGGFAIHDVLPGAYRLRASQRNGTELLVAESQVTVPAGGLDGVRLTLFPVASVPVRVEPPSQQCSVTMESAGGFPFNGSSRTAPEPERAAITAVPPGVYRVKAYCDRAYVASMRFGTEDVTATRLITVPPGSGAPPITIHAERGAALAVQSPGGAPLPAIVVPESSSEAPHMTYGHAPSLTPGRYTIYPLPADFDRVPYLEPEFLRGLSGGVSVTLAAGETATVKLPEVRR